MRDFASSGTRLRRAKRTATGVLVGCVILLLVSRGAASSRPAFAYVEAFAEAAVIGGLADWYAVVAIFRRPFGLPLPHTAIVARKRDRIADQLGNFIQENFLGADIVGRRLREIDFVAHACRWMCDPSNATFVAERLAAVAPVVLDAVERSGLPGDLFDGIERRLSELDAGRAASAILRSPLVSANRQRLLDAALEGVLRLLSSPEILAELRESMRREMPALLKLSGGDHTVFRKIVLALAAYIDAVRADAAHPLRADVDRLLDRMVDEIENSTGTAARVAQLRDDLLAGLKASGLDEQLFSALRRLVESEGFAASLARELGHAMPQIGNALDLYEKQTGALNKALRTGIANAVASRSEDIGAFVATQVKSWDVDEVTALVEDNIGPDLQYIRLNGAIVGGLAGLAIFTVSRLFGWH